MKIVIAGAGEVGSHLAKLLSNEEQDITLVDQDAERLGVLDANYNLMTVVGDPTSFTTLREADAGRCDLFIAVTPYESNNIVACSIAKNLGAKKTVARISSYDFMDPANSAHVKHMGVDKLIYPEYLAAEEIITALRRNWIRNWFELHDGQIILAGIKLRAGAPIIGMKLRDFSFTNHHFHVSAIKRNHETIIPRGDDHIAEGDILYFTTTRDHIDELITLSGKTEQKIRRVLIMGGTKIAVRLVNLAGDEFRFKIIEDNRDMCNRLPQKCPDCEIIHGDARDADLLDEIGISEMDAFVALTESSETNIFSCITAKDLGIKKTIADVENVQFISQAENLNIGTVINKKLLASSTIFQMLLDSDSSTTKCLALADAEVAEIEARPGSRITKAPVKDLRLVREMTLAGLIRDGKGELITGMTHIRPGDHVLVFCLAGSLHKVEKFFV
ncbi:MAG: Trk system potassium transporter TrkA [Bacteroidales bacterium]|nr:Trk system potassium transporter TrkA [Bacteroidales bacterium]MBD5219697.1 Trk system potassium transporter TrkA [Bacteroidales bacterium]MDE6436854.1 Trk system potassium transporter TrkA [Muribaculaceae bacterium]